MSKIKLQTPVIHTPSFPRYKISRAALVDYLRDLEIEPFPKGFAFFDWYVYTTLEGWGKVLLDLVFKSDLYKDTFKCADYALKSQTECARRYGLNSLRLVLDRRSNLKGHAYCLFPFGDETGLQGVKLFEPNEGYQWSGILSIGEFEYTPVKILI